MTLIKICNKIIEYSFYGLFLLVPLAFTSATSELFELNKMWLTWGLTIIIGMAWFVKMILQRKFFIQKTPLDIPIVLFLLSQIISTIFSQDVHVSFWGYYSRFNGGLLSIISYIFLYYAFVSNFISENSEYSEKQTIRYSDRQTVRQSGSPSFPSVLNNNPIKMVKRLLFISLVSGLIVALWGLPSHFGYDPTCLIFRGAFDVSCWTADFMPKIRIFSTLGQPDWLAAYLAILIPISITMALNNLRSQNKPHEKLQISSSKLQRYNSNFKFTMYIFYLLLTILFYLDLLFTRARSGVLGVWFSLIFLASLYYWVNGRPKISFSKEKLKSPLSLLFFGFLIITFIIGTPINQLHRFTLEGVGSYFQKTQISKTADRKIAVPTPTPAQSFESGGTESADIRLNVWTGAINAWKSNPLFGTGVETFAFAYYKYKPAAQNLTSEWNFLYNKAHNEYLNYLATTGIFGLGAYLLMIGWFIYLTIKQFKIQNAKLKITIQNSKLEKLSTLNSNFSLLTLNFALLASYISILITNFFGFSVVIINIYLFMIPAFVFTLGGMLKSEKEFIFPRNESESMNYESRTTETSLYQWTFIFFIILASLFMLSNLFRFWRADIAYALGYNLDRAGEYEEGYPNLHKAVALRGDEPVFKDELSINNAIIAAGLLAQKDEKTKDRTIAVASSLVQEAINTSNEIVTKYPNNAVFWKTRTRVFYTLSQVDPRYLPRALDSIKKASLLAPQDANIIYNLGVLYGQNNDIKKGIEALEKTIILKSDYRDAHYALGLFYHQQADPALQEKAIAQMQYILDHIAPQDAGALESITNWSK